jgi:two-component system, response regulator PdtaR
MSRHAASVLTVEDDPITRADLRIVLEEAGFSVCADARDGIEAVELAWEHKPDLILLDLGLPRLDGVEATRRILAARAVPIVALTGRSTKLAEEAIGAGATSYVTKPFDEAEIVAALREAPGIHRQLTTRTERAESLHTIRQVLDLMGYPEDWATRLEQEAFERGHVWRISWTADGKEER